MSGDETDGLTFAKTRFLLSQHQKQVEELTKTLNTTRDTLTEQVTSLESKVYIYIHYY